MTVTNKGLFKTSLVSIALLLSDNQTIAKTTEWLMTPQYDQMELYASDLYKVMLNGKFGLINSQGRVVLSPEYDLISDFFEGMAVFGNYTSDGIAIKGAVNEGNKISRVSGVYYLLNDYPFFSEGFIPVSDESGRYGYLDESCRPSFKFGNDETRPFSEGFAAVGEGDDFHWLTTAGEEIYLTLPNGSYPYGGTNFYNGIAYLWDEYGEDFFILDASGNVRKIKPRELTVDYLYRVDSDKGADVDYREYKGLYNQVWKPAEKNGKWSYKDSKGNLLSSFQYDEVDFFQGVSARACVNGKWGLLQMVEDNASFYATSDKKLHVFTSNKASDCSFQLSVPDKWKDEDLIVSIKDPETGESFDLSRKQNNVYSFTYQPDQSKSTVSKTFVIDVINNGVSIWQGEENYEFAQAIKLLASLNVRNKADAGNRCFVTATISNPSSIPVTTTVTLSGGGSNSKFNTQKVNMTIPANSKRSVTSAFVLSGVELDGWCAVATTDGGYARRNNLELKPRD